MSEKDIQVDFSRLRTYECGALLVAILALPKGSESERDSLIESLCNYALRAQFNSNNPKIFEEQLMKPVYALRKEEFVRRDLRKLNNHIRDRISAARMAIPYLQNAVTGAPPKLPAGIASMSLNNIAALAQLDPSSDIAVDSSNVETRIWRASLPVIHFAVPMAIATQNYAKEGGELRLEHFLFERALVDWLFGEAEKYAAVIEKGGVFPGKTPSLVRVRLPTG